MTGSYRQLAARSHVDVIPTATQRPSAATASVAREKSALNRKCSVSELGLFSLRRLLAELCQWDLHDAQ